MAIKIVLLFSLIINQSLGNPLDFSPNYQSIMRYDKNLGFTYLPNTKTHSIDPQKTILYRINNYGFRDHNYKLPLDKKLIAIFGGSETFGLGINEDQRWSNVLAKKLNHYSVFNMARAGLSFDLIYLLMKKYFNEFKPDIALIVVTRFIPLETAFHAKPYYWQNQPKPFFKINNELNELKFYTAKEFKRPHHWYINQSDHTFIKKLKENINHYFLKYFDRNILKLTEKKAIKTGELLIDQAQELCLQYKVKCIYLYNQGYLKEIFEKKSLPALDIKLRPSKKYFINHYIKHINAEGNENIAKKVYQNLLDKEIITDEKD